MLESVKSIFKSENSEWIAKNHAGDGRLKRIWNILDLYGFLTFSDKWKWSPKPVIIVILLAVSYSRDLILFARKVVSDDLGIPADVELLTFMQTESITALRLYIFITKRKEIRNMVAMMVNEFPSWLDGDGKRKRFDKCITKGMAIYWFHVFQLVSVGTLLVLRPLVGRKSHGLLLTPPLGSLPYLPSDTTPFYQITYIFQACEKPMEIAMAFCINMMFFTIVIRVCGHIECMSMDLDKVGNTRLSLEEEEVEVEEEEEEEADVILTTFVHRHNTIKRFIEDFNKTFFISTSIQPIYTGISMITSLLVFDRTQDTFSFAGIAVAHMLEHFIYCFAGNLIAEKSYELGERLYSSQWSELSIRQKKSVLQIMQNCTSTKTLSIKAGMFGTFTRPMFTTTMRTTYSVWAVVSQVK